MNDPIATGGGEVVGHGAWLRRCVTLVVCWCAGAATPAAPPRVHHDAERRQVTLVDGSGRLELRLRYDGRCVLDTVRVDGRDVVDPASGVWTGVKETGTWRTTQRLTAPPQVNVSDGTVVVRGIAFDGGGIPVRETWQLVPEGGRIRWRIEREYGMAGRVEEIAMAGWDFASRSTWTGALLGHGGVAWGRLFDRPDATYGVHSAPVTFWEREQRGSLRVVPVADPGRPVATRVTRRGAEGLSMVQSVSETRLTTKHGQARFLRDRDDVWAPTAVASGAVVVELSLEVTDYESLWGRGELVGIDGTAVREILNTIARIGAVDDEIMGSNGYYSGYAVLHEPWIAQLGLAIDDPAYFAAFTRTLDHQRDHAVGGDGRVKSRWSYNAGDAMPGSYDEYGYYECQWGMLMDSQPSYAINVAEQFDFTGDVDWLRSHKATVERALDYLLRRDADGDGLVEMMTESPRSGRGSDWIDVIWASHENAFVNAQLYEALQLWSEREAILGDAMRAAEYRRRANRLREGFNRSTAEGGFWDETKGCYVHWRDLDGTVHGNNWVLPVNFMAIAYGLCESPGRALNILRAVEARMEKEGSFFWPLCLDSYRKDEGAALQFPFPSYENGDLFLAWGEIGTRAYARYDPTTALKYVRKTLARYSRDGLAFQRYLRNEQRGTGDDILANNCSPVVGLYRNIYGVRPRWNRLCLEPHLTPDLNGTRFGYWLRGKTYEIRLSVGGYSLGTEGVQLRSAEAFGLEVEGAAVRYYPGTKATPELSWVRPEGAQLRLVIESWPEDGRSARRWSVAGPGTRTVLEQIVGGLEPETEYEVLRPESERSAVRSDAQGKLRLQVSLDDASVRHFELRPPAGRRE